MLTNQDLRWLHTATANQLAPAMRRLKKADPTAYLEIASRYWVPGEEGGHTIMTVYVFGHELADEKNKVVIRLSEYISARSSLQSAMDQIARVSEKLQAIVDELIQEVIDTAEANAVGGALILHDLTSQWGHAFQEADDRERTAGNK